jgi:hypothetical protein
MKIINKISTLIFVSVLITTVLGQFDASQKTIARDEILKRRVEGIHLDNITILDALRETFSAAQVPAGIIMSQNCEEQIKYSLKPTGSSLHEMLDALRLVSSSYRWTAEDGIVEFFATTSYPQLLKFRVTEYKVETKMTLNGMLNQLLTTAEVRKRMTELNIGEVKTQIGMSSLSRPGASSSEGKKQITLRLKNVTIQEILNAIVRAHGQAVWVYSEGRCGKRNEFRLEFIAQ